jgi:succinate dehydrogenase/fumarate reductase flavoprotein subunit
MNPLNSKIKRRGFMGVVGGSCAVIGAAAITGQNSACAQNGGGRPSGPPQRGRTNTAEKKNAVEGTIHQLTTDVLVVGGGMAGVFAAVTAHDNGAQVLLVDKGSVGRSGQTPFARGIFRYDEATAGMTPSEFLKATAEAAEYMNNPIYTKLMLDHSAECVDKLESWGFFKEVNYANALNSPLRKRNIELIERVTLTHLIKEGGRVVGAMGMYIDKNESVAIHAKSVILCTGASGFKPAGWQIGSLTSDGDAMAYRIGAEITGKEWVDGHSRTNNGLEGTNRIVSSSGNRISAMLGVEENIDVNKYGPSSGGMMMGPPGGGGPGGQSSDSSDRRGPPPGDNRMAGGGGSKGEGPTSMGGASAGMSQHKAEGLFPQDDKCSSNIPGLFAAGDALGSMQSGGVYTQVGSSLVGSAVQGAVAGKTAARYIKKASLSPISDGRMKKINTEIYAPYLRERGFSPRWVTHTLQSIMIPNYILYVKREDRMMAALTHIEYLRDHHLPLLMADNLHELRLCHETENMVLNAEMKLRAALMRKESRGSHYREDYPKRNDKEWLCWIKIRQGSDGNMELVKQPLPGRSLS